MLFLTFFVCASFALCNGELKPPTNIRVNRYLTSGAEVQWDFILPTQSSGNVTPEVMYLVQYKRIGEIYWRTAQVYQQPLYLIPLLNGETYQLQIRATSANDVSQWSELFTFTMPGSPRNQPLLSPPSDLHVAVVTPSSVHLRWNFQAPLTLNEDIYYLVLMQEQIPNTNSFGGDREIRVKSRTFLLEQLELGVMYKFQVKVHIGHDESGYSNEVVVRMPAESDLFAVTNVNVIYSDEFPNYVNLSWSVPDTVKREVIKYVIWYSTVKDSDTWVQHLVSGREPQTVIGPLAPNTTTYFSVETYLQNNLSTESNVFQFQSPQATALILLAIVQKPDHSTLQPYVTITTTLAPLSEWCQAGLNIRSSGRLGRLTVSKVTIVNPIEDVNVMYTKNVGSVQLQWKVKSQFSSVSNYGYEIVLSKDNTLAENFWNRFSLPGTSPLLLINNLEPATKYYARIYIRKQDGSFIPSATTYQFVTLDQQSSMVSHMVSLSYERVTSSIVKVRWIFPVTQEMPNITGSLVFYTDQPNKEEKEWMKIVVPNNTNEALMTGLATNVTYYVKVLPRNTTTTMFMNTGAFRIDPYVPFNFEVTSELVMESKTTNATMAWTNRQVQNLCLRACHSVNECASNERCVMLDGSMGFCMPEILIKAIKP